MSKAKEKLKWVNTKRVVWKKIIHPCWMTGGVCPYGALVELYPIQEAPSVYSCSMFGHDCPSHYLSEPACDEGERPTRESFEVMMKEIDKFYGKKKVRK